MEHLLTLLRARGWRVTVHNDYRQNGKDFTFWSFSRGNQCVKGEGPNDFEALYEVLAHPLVQATIEPGATVDEALGWKT